ncbi:MAG: nicotinamide-nucleotide amidase [Gammaproteobacteria bacterium]
MAHPDRRPRTPDLARQVGDLLQAGALRMASAESCTGGWIAKRMTDIEGSSRWFDRGFVTYSNEAKHEVLGVREQTLARHGAVSRETVEEMAAGALARSRADIAVAVTGIAGPGGGSADKPVGTVWIAWARRGQAVQAEARRFGGDRENVRRAAVHAALVGLAHRLRS